MSHPVRHLSASSVGCYLGCPAKWRYRYIERLPEAPSEALERGTMVHQALERYWTGTYGKPEQGIHRYISAYRKMSGAIEPEQVQAVELELRANLAGVDVPLLGFIDCYTTDDLIVDLKTAGKPWRDGRAPKELQPALYAYLARANGYQVRGFEFHILVNAIGSSRVDTFRVPVKLNDDLIEEHLDNVREVWQGIVAEEFPPRRTILCAYCDHAEACRLDTGIEPVRGAR